MRGLILVFGFCFSAAFAFAQEDATNLFDFDTWEKTASRAEQTIEKAEASSPALETLRQSLVEFRAEALALQDANKDRVSTIQSQLDALGPHPEDGTEAADIAQRRAALTGQLATANAPTLAAQEAYNRANGLIGEIDSIIRDRLKVRLFTLGPSPLNPTYWRGAAASLGLFFADASAEVAESWSSEAQRVQMQKNLPVTLALLVAGLVLLGRARQWVVAGLGQMPTERLALKSESRYLLFSLTRLVVPTLGVWALGLSAASTGLIGIRGQIIVDAAPLMGVTVFAGQWLGQTLFGNDEAAPKFFSLDSTEASMGRQLALLMGGIMALHQLLARIAMQADFEEVSYVVSAFPVVLGAGFLLVRMGALLDPGRTDKLKPDAPATPLQDRILFLLMRGAIIIGVMGPLLAAVGYFTAATAFVFPAIVTLALLGASVITHRLFCNLVLTLISRGNDDAKDAAKQGALVPAFSGFALIAVSVPVLALIWGARVSDLSEIWTVINNGFTLGDRRISVADFLSFVVVFAVGYTLTRLLQSTLRTSVLPNTNLDAGGRNAVLTGTGYVGIFLAAIAAISAGGLDLSSFAIVAGALSVGIGFGLQAIVSNFVSGIILLVERPIKEGDWIEVGAYSGYVKKISVRSTEIQTFDRATLIIPNADFITSTVTNRTHANLHGRVRIPIGVGYDSDPRQVEEILLEIASAHNMLAVGTSPSVVFMGFGADSMDFEIRAILRDVNYSLSVKSDINYQIVERFRREGIEIPFAQRDINLRNLGDLGETLKGAIGEGKT